jgi:hypothetical protein
MADMFTFAPGASGKSVIAENAVMISCPGRGAA